MIQFIKNRSLAFKMVLFICAAVLCIFMVIFLYSYNHAKNIITRNLETNAALIAQKTVGNVRNLLSSIEKIPINLSEQLSERQYSDSELLPLLHSMMRRNPEIFGIAVAYDPYMYSRGEYYHSPYVYRQGGSILSSYLGSEEYDYPLMDWFQISRELDTTYWTEPYFDENGGGVFMTTFSAPFYRTINGKKVFCGVVTADVSLEGLIAAISRIKVYETGYCFVVSRTGTIAAHPLREAIMNESMFSLAEEKNYPDMRKLGHLMQSGTSGKSTFEYRNLKTGKLSWFYYASVKGNGWTAGVLYPVEELMGDVTRLSRFVLLLAIAGALLLVVIISYIAQSITRPIRSLAQASKQIAGGDFNHEVRLLRRKDEVGDLNHSFIRMQHKLKSYIEDLKKTTAEMQKIESELQIAHDIQMSIIPKLFPPFPERTDLDLFGTLIPVKEVGGDLYDFFFIDETRLVLAIGDVSGKGVPASLFMAVTRTLLRARFTRNAKASDIVRIVNDDLCKENTQKMFVTFFLAILNVATGELEYCNAGHNPPYIIGANGIRELEAFHGYPLGIQADKPYKSARERMRKGETIVLFTDGITEAENKQFEFFEEEKLLKVLAEHAEDTAQQLTKAILDGVNAFTMMHQQSDDITLLVMKYLGDGRGETAKSAVFKYSILVKQNIDELIKLQGELDSLFTAWHITQETVNDYQLVFEELMTNIIYYAFNDEAEHFIVIRINYEDGVIITRIEDDGVEFNPLNAEDPGIPTSIRGVKPGGLGIFLCKKILDTIEYRRTDGKNILTFTKANI